MIALYLLGLQTMMNAIMPFFNVLFIIKYRIYSLYYIKYNIIYNI